MLKCVLIVGSNHPSRLADVATSFVIAGAAGRHDLQVDVLDLTVEGLQFQAAPDASINTMGHGTALEADTWRRRIGRYDAFVAMVAEYNYGTAAVLKNAFDIAGSELHRKPIAIVGYGGLGSARAIEHLRRVADEVQMAPIRHQLNIAMESLLGVLQHGRPLEASSGLVHARTAMFDHLVSRVRCLDVTCETDRVRQVAAL